MAKSKADSALFDLVEQFLQEGGKPTHPALRKGLKLSQSQIASALGEFEKRGRIRVANPSARRKRYMIVSDVSASETTEAPTAGKRKGRPSGSTTDAVALKWFTTLRQHADPKRSNPHWGMIEALAKLGIRAKKFLESK